MEGNGGDLWGLGGGGGWLASGSINEGQKADHTYTHTHPLGHHQHHDTSSAVHTHTHAQNRYSELLRHAGEAPVAVRRCETVDEVLQEADVSRSGVVV